MHPSWVRRHPLVHPDCHVDECMPVVNLEIKLTFQWPGSAPRDSLISTEGTSVGKALTTASAAKPERAVKREKRIVIKLRIGNVGVLIGSSAWWFEAVAGHIYIFRQSGQCTVSTNGENMCLLISKLSRDDRNCAVNLNRLWDVHTAS